MRSTKACLIAVIVLLILVVIGMGVAWFTIEPLPMCLYWPKDLLFSIGGVNYKLDRQEVRCFNYVLTCHFRNFISVEFNELIAMKKLVQGLS